jgi:uncharacterized protein YdhG (YjbR/CyaY superfamily)
MSDTKMPAKRAAASGQDTWSDEERAAIREYAREKKSAARGAAARAEGESDVLAKIAEMPQPDRGLAERLHAIVKTSAPGLAPRTWYGMPAYARDGKVICFFQAASKFKVRYGTFGFQQDAKLDDGALWPVAFAITELTPAVEAQIAELVKKAAG